MANAGTRRSRLARLRGASRSMAEPAGARVRRLSNAVIAAVRAHEGQTGHTGAPVAVHEIGYSTEQFAARDAQRSDHGRRLSTRTE